LGELKAFRVARAETSKLLDGARTLPAAGECFDADELAFLAVMAGWEASTVLVKDGNCSRRFAIVQKMPRLVDEGCIHVFARLGICTCLARGRLRLVCRGVARLGNALRRSVTSVPLNLSEGAYSQGGNGRSRFHTALGSAAEVRACLDVAEALGYVKSVDAGLRDKVDHIIATVTRLVKR